MSHRNDRAPPAAGRLAGMSLVEVAITISLLGLILVGVMGALSTGFMARRSTTEVLENQYFAREVLEEIESTPYSGLLSFNGTAVTSPDGKCRASIAVAGVGTNLLRISVVSRSQTDSRVQVRLATLMAKLD